MSFTQPVPVVQSGTCSSSVFAIFTSSNVVYTFGSSRKFDFCDSAGWICYPQPSSRDRSEKSSTTGFEIFASSSAMSTLDSYDRAGFYEGCVKASSPQSITGEWWSSKSSSSGVSKGVFSIIPSISPQDLLRLKSSNWVTLEGISRGFSGKNAISLLLFFR